MKSAFGKTLRRVREQRRVSQERLSDRAGVARTYVGRVERACLNPTMGSMDRLLTALGVTWAEFGVVLDTVKAAHCNDPPPRSPGSGWRTS
jgi:transcriptional regulator with XRE-family HTH domain